MGTLRECLWKDLRRSECAGWTYDTPYRRLFQPNNRPWRLRHHRWWRLGPVLRPEDGKTSGSASSTTPDSPLTFPFSRESPGRTPPTSLDGHLGYWLRHGSNHVSVEFAPRLEERGRNVVAPPTRISGPSDRPRMWIAASTRRGSSDSLVAAQARMRFLARQRFRYPISPT